MEKNHDFLKIKQIRLFDLNGFLFKSDF